MKHTEQNAKTQATIKQAFITLIQTKGFSNLTVSDITRQAAVSRGTFYVHYIDKFDLLQKVEDELYDNLAATLSTQLDETLNHKSPADKSDALYSTFTLMLDYVNSERSTLQALFSQNGDPQLFNRIKLLFDEIVSAKLTAYDGHFSTKLPIDYTKEIALNSMLNIVRYWLNKAEPETTEEIAQILLKSRFLAPHDLLIFE
ncbi:MAG: TetR/AcrR family transcriptional regulator [Lactobacillaceae bacterium]|jgi:AcrR family transcriptional regulator|nr:TetR/AcrR family transcriptional regulator [Lactobacillaceae bacterium]